MVEVGLGEAEARAEAARHLLAELVWPLTTAASSAALANAISADSAVQYFPIHPPSARLITCSSNRPTAIASIIRTTTVHNWRRSSPERLRAGAGLSFHRLPSAGWKS